MRARKTLDVNFFYKTNEVLFQAQTLEATVESPATPGHPVGTGYNNGLYYYDNKCLGIL